MNKSLSTFMLLAITAIILSSLLIGTVYQVLFNKNIQHEDTLQQVHQLN
ncbi:hypothetical protein [Bacillus alkalicellulosilyticus]|nr:hypothetical protein [Bacillus alkalicellulosilyticus]